MIYFLKFYLEKGEALVFLFDERRDDKAKGFSCCLSSHTHSLPFYLIISLN
jgi:hypothetical protein